MEGAVLLIVQTTVTAFLLFIIATFWARLILRTDIICSRRDGNIVGQNLILTSMAFVGIFASIYDQPGIQQIIVASNQTVYYLLLLLVVLWLICSQLVKGILKKPKDQTSKFIIDRTRFIINFVGITSIVVCRLLLAKTFIGL